MDNISREILTFRPFLLLKWFVFGTLTTREAYYKTIFFRKKELYANATFSFCSITLPYPMDGLEPFFPKSLVSDHYQNFYLPQLNELNRLLKNCPSLHSAVLGKLLCWPSLIPSACRRQILESAGGVYCHQFYFFSLCPPRKPSLPGQSRKSYLP